MIKFWQRKTIDPIAGWSPEEIKLLHARSTFSNAEKEFTIAREAFITATSDLAKANSEYLLSIERKIPNGKRSHKNL